jgi:hypothetical protein
MTDTDKINAKLAEFSITSKRYSTTAIEIIERQSAALRIALQGLRELERVTGRYHEFVALREKAIAETLEGNVGYKIGVEHDYPNINCAPSSDINKLDGKL